MIGRLPRLSRTGRKGQYQKPFEREKWADYSLEQLFDCLKLGPSVGAANYYQASAEWSVGSSKGRKRLTSSNRSSESSHRSSGSTQKDRQIYVGVRARYIRDVGRERYLRCYPSYALRAAARPNVAISPITGRLWKGHRNIVAVLGMVPRRRLITSNKRHWRAWPQRGRMAYRQPN